MERNKTLSLCANPFSVWTDLALNTCEMMVASAEVIGHRAGLMAVSGPIPNVSDQREFALMGQEKIDAAAESARAMAEFVMTMNCQIGAQAFSQMLTGFSLAASSSIGQSLERQGDLVRTMTDSAITASQLPNSAGLLAQSAVRPTQPLRHRSCPTPPACWPKARSGPSIAGQRQMPGGSASVKK